MNKSEIFKAAHKLTKEVVKAGDNYQVTFSAALACVYEGLNSDEFALSFDYRREEGWSFYNQADMYGKNQLVVRNDSVAFEIAKNQKFIEIIFDSCISDLHYLEIVEEVPQESMITPKNCTVFKIIKYYK